LREELLDNFINRCGLLEKDEELVLSYSIIYSTAD
jgi:hypothetical protein